MRVGSELVGRCCAPVDVVLNARRAMNYAAAVADENPRYFDDTRPQGVVMPPMAVVALTWQITSENEQSWHGGLFPPEIARRQVHLTETIEWRRPMRPGDRLRIEGTCRAILPWKSGTLVVLEYIARDPQGEVVFVERIGGLLRNVECADAGRGQEFAPRPTPDAPAPGVIWEKPILIDRLAAHRYDGGADIHFPIHTSPAYARAAGLPDIIYQGTATLAQAVRELTDHEAGRDPGRLRSVECNFGAMVIPGTEIVVRLLDRKPETDCLQLQFEVLNAEGKPAIRRGILRVSRQG